MYARLLAFALVVVAAGCGQPAGHSPTLSVGGPTTRQDQRRAVAGKEASTVGAVTAEVVSWEVKKRKEIAGADTRPGQEDCIVIRLRFSTTDDTVKVSTGTMLFDGRECKDDFGNRYAFDTWSPGLKGDEFTHSVTRETPVNRILLIEKPIPKASRLDLDLSAAFAGAGANEWFRFTIPLNAGRN